MEKVSTDLDYNDDPEFEHKAKLVKKIVVLFLLSVVIAALMVVFGHSWSTKRNLTKPDVAAVAYERLLRVNKPSDMKIKMNAVEEDTVELKINSGYFEKVQVKLNSPQPVKCRFNGGDYSFFFLTRPRSTAELQMSIKAMRAGNVAMFLKCKKDSMCINQFIYP
jgi:hypothetical protein